MRSVPKRVWIVLGVLCFAGILQATVPLAVVSNWTASTNLSQARANSVAVMLPDGSTLFTGGDNNGSALQTAEIFGVNGSVTSVAQLNVPRTRHFAVVLNDGRVLVGGGNTSGGGATNSAEIYDPAANNWNLIGSMTSARANATAALLQDGRVVIAGGDNAGTPNNTIEIYDPSSGSFSFAGTLSSPRTQHAMALLQDGRVLIVGGFDGNNPLTSSDIFDPTNGSITSGPSLATARYSMSATTLMNGQVAVIGGTGQGSNGTVDLASIEIFDPTTNAFSDAGVTLSTAREGHQAFVLPNNNTVLIAGGTSGGAALASAELLTPQVSVSNGSWTYAVSSTASMTTASSGASGSANQANGPSSTGLKPGMVVVAGGNDASGAALASSEVYGYATVQTDQSDYPPGTTVTINGNGFKPGENVAITLVESPLIDTHGPYTVVADGNGNFTDSSFTTDIHDVNVRFWLSAVGSQSGVVAENTFTDATATNTTLTSNPNPSVVNQPVTFTATVRNGSTQGQGTPVSTGTVTFAIGGNSNCGGGATIFASNVAVNANGQATAQNTFTSASGSPFTIHACYNGTGGQGTQSSSDQISQTVSAVVGTTTTVSSSANPSVFGQSVAFTATVTPNTGASTPTGSIQFVVDGANFGSTVNLVGGSATSASTSTLSVSGLSHTVIANYTATGNFSNSNGSLTGGQMVNKASTSSTVASSLNPSNYGQSVTFTATVGAISPGNGTPTGTVDFKDGTTVIAAAVALSGGQGSFSTSALSAVTHSITAVYSGDGNFNATGVGGSTATALSQVVKPATLTASIINNPTKPYDGNTTATLNSANFSLSGLVGTDSFTINQTGGTYNSKDVATASTVTASLSTGNFVPVGGTQASNYTLPTSASGPGHITAVPVTAGVIGTPAKPYDGNTTATLTPANFSLTGLVGSESFTVTKTSGTYNSKDVSTATTVSATLSATDFVAGPGTLATNYTLATTASGAGQISPKTLSASIIGNPSKTYDGTTTATLASANFSLTGVITGESITITQTSGSYNSKDVASANTVTANLVPANFTAGAGTLLSNYTLPTSASGAGQISPKMLTASIIGSPAKIYDGTISATLTSANFSLVGMVAGESISVTQTSGAYNSKDVLSANTVTASLAAANFTAVAGTLLSNYTLPTTASGAGQITPKTVTASIMGNPTKAYDGTTTATLSPANFSLSGLVGSESFTVTKTSGTYNSKDVVTATTIDVALATTDFTPSGGAIATNYTLPTSASGAGQITAVTVTASIVGNPSKPYDGTTAATLTSANFQLANVVSGESITMNQTAGSYNSKDVLGANSVTANLSAANFSPAAGTLISNYVLPNSASGSGQITPKTVTASIVGTPSKTYDGTTNATLTSANFSLTGEITGESFTVTQTAGNYNSKDVTTAATVSATLGAGNFTTGANTLASNYNLPTSATGAGQITSKTVTAAIIGNPTKTYDGTTAATLAPSNFSLTGVIAGESFTVTQTAGTYNTKAVTATSVSATLSAGDFTPGMSTLASNYALPTTASGSGQINPRPLTVTATGVNRMYDGTTAATVTLSDNRISGDVMTDNYSSASFLDKNVGTAKPVSVSGISITGSDAGDYTLQNTTANTTADIAPRPLTVTAAGVNRVYDGTATATVTLSDDRVAGDVLTDNYGTASFNDKNVGMGKPVNVSGISITGTDSGNYSLQNTTASATADITARPLTISATGVSKTYDGTVTATVTLSDNRVAGDVFTDNYTNASFTDKNAGTGKTISVTGISISGTDSGNYTFNTTASTTADISQRPLTVGASGVTKVYDGTSAATVTLSDDRISGDVFTDNYASANFADKNVGNNKSVSVTGISISGADAGNYQLLNTTAATAADITQRPLTVTATGVNKVYDGNSTANVVLSDNRVAGDSLTDNFGSASFPDKNVGSGKPVNVTGISISGGDSNNYHLLNTTASTTADITQRTLAVTAHASNKVYDGYNTASVTLTDDHLGSDVVTVSFTSATFSDKNVGTAKTVTVTGLAISGGTDAGNYTLNGVTQVNTVDDITVRSITVTATTNSRVYDGSTSAAATPAITSGNLVGTDTPNFTEAYTNRNAGGGLTLVPSGSVNDGNGGNNYQVTFANNAMGVISQRPITVTAQPDTKTFDGTTTSNVTPVISSAYSPAVVSPDSPNFTQAFNSANAGPRTMVPAGSVSDGNGGLNYAVSFVNAAGTINPAATATSVAAVPNPATLGQSITFTATVSNTATSPVPTGTVQFVIDGSNFGAPVAVSAGVASVSTSTLTAGTHTIAANYVNSDGNFKNSAGSLAGTETVQFGFLGLFAPYQPPSAGVAYKINSAIPLKWQYTNNGGTVVNSSNANPVVQIYVAPCDTGVDTTTIVVNDAGASGYQYDSTTNTWQFNWKTTGLGKGCYNIYIHSTLTNQTTAAFPIQLR